MKQRGDGPQTYGQGRMERVSAEADARWLLEQERKAKAKQAKITDEPYEATLGARTAFSAKTKK
jgi:hypothetical protein